MIYQKRIDYLGSISVSLDSVGVGTVGVGVCRRENDRVRVHGSRW